MVRITLLLLLLFATPSWAFVEKLHPNQRDVGSGGIPCNAMWSVLFDYAKPGGPPPAILNSRIQREWVPEGWSEQDKADNQAIIQLMDSKAPSEKYILAFEVQSACLLWELGVDEFDTPQKFRLRIGIPPAP